MREDNEKISKEIAVNIIGIILSLILGQVLWKEIPPTYIALLFPATTLLYHFANFLWTTAGLINLKSFLEKECQKIVDWIIKQDIKWGLFNKDTNETLHATTADGIMALQAHMNYAKDKQVEKSRTTFAYTVALKNLMEALEETGVSSKSLEEKTIICTGMALFILDRKEILKDKALMKRINAASLAVWEARKNIAGEFYGWGSYLCEKNKETNDKNVRMTSSFWAFRGLMNRKKEDTEFVTALIEFYGKHCDKESLFGFYSNGRPKQIVMTAMFALLYLEASSDIKNKIEINTNFKIEKAVKYILKNYKKEELVYEEAWYFYKNKKNYKGIYTHTTLGWCLELIGRAYQSQKTNEIKKVMRKSELNGAILFLRKILKDSDRVKEEDNDSNYKYYIPLNMQTGAKGHDYTFPSFDLLKGAYSLLCAKYHKQPKKDATLSSKIVGPKKEK